MRKIVNNPHLSGLNQIEATNSNKHIRAKPNNNALKLYFSFVHK